MPYRIRLLRGALELKFEGQQLEPPRAPAQLGALAVMALHPGREVPLETFKTKLYECDPAHVSNAAIQTPIARLRHLGLPIPLRRYVLEVEPAEVDLVDVDDRMKEFIELAANLDGLSPTEQQDAAEQGLETDELWQEDPSMAVGSSPQHYGLFEAYRKRHRRFGEALVKLQSFIGEHERALGTLERYVERYGDDLAWTELEWQVETARRQADSARRGPSDENGETPALPILSTAVLSTAVPAQRPHPTEVNEHDDLEASFPPGQRHVSMPGPEGRTRAFDEILELLDQLNQRQFDELVVSSHNLDRVFTVDQVVVADDQVRVDHPVEAPGGAGANTAAGLARLGQRVAVAGIVARDRDGVILRRDLVQEDIDVSNLLMVEQAQGRTGHAYIFSDPQGRRGTYIHSGINEQWSRTLKRQPQAAAQLIETAADARIVHLGSFSGPGERRLLEELVVELPEETLVSFDPGTMYSPMGLDRLEGIMVRCNILQVYEHQLHNLVTKSSASAQASPFDHGDARSDLDALLRWRYARGALRPLVILLKRHRAPGEESKEVAGFEDVIMVSGRESIEELVSPQAPSGRVPELTDTTGAGDAMATGLHHGLLSGRSAYDCIDLAYVMAMSTSSEFGSRAGLVTNSGLEGAWRRHLPAVDVPLWLKNGDTEGSAQVS